LTLYRECTKQEEIDTQYDPERSAPGAKFCADCGAVLEAPAAAWAKRFDEPQIRVADAFACESVDGERKMVTALFADIKGSTELMRDLDPEEARAIVDPVLHLMMESVHRYGGYVAQSASTYAGRRYSSDVGQQRTHYDAD
jgi:class 3 adenylate cyclase